jgi:hypothetical protein
MQRQLINDLLNANSISEINDLVFKYTDLLDENRRLYSFVSNARKRVNNLRRMKFQNIEIIYLN